MKYAFHVAPNMQSKDTTMRIMRDLGIALGIVYICALIYYGSDYGMDYAWQILLLLGCSLATTFICEFVFAKVKKENPLEFIKHSYGWITSMIFVLMCPVTITPYAVIIGTLFAIVVARLMFGGFGNNIYNPAAIGRAVIFAAFSGAATSLTTAATPTTTMATQFHWLPQTPVALDAFLDSYGGWLSLFVGTYPGAIGETFTLSIVLVGILLILRNVIDWRIPVCYLSSLIVFALLAAALMGVESWNGIPGWLWYPFLHLLLGGAVFGAFFMLTDPVTMPTAAMGRVVYAIFAAAITILIRLKGNLPEGVLYSILIMNTFTPMIESALDGVQLKQRKKAAILSLCGLLLGIGVCFYASSTIEPVTDDPLTSATSSASGDAESGATESTDTESAATEEADTESAATEESAAQDSSKEQTAQQSSIESEGAQAAQGDGTGNQETDTQPSENNPETVDQSSAALA